MTKVKVIGGIFVILLVVGGIPYCSYEYDRWKNYNFGYESQVTDTICALVKSEALKDPSMCQ